MTPAGSPRRRGPPALAWVLALCWACSPPATAQTLDLLEVYAQARAADPVLASALAQRGQQQELATQARASLLPQWSLSVAEQRQQSDGSRERVLSHNLSQVLVDLSRLRSLDAANTLASAEQARVRAAEAELCARVARAYFGVLSAQASVQTAQAIEAAYGQQVQQAQARFEARLSAALDLEQARAYHELARASSLSAAEALADARQALAEITGRLPEGLQPLQAELPLPLPEPADPQAWVAQALRDNPALRALDLGLSASEQRLAAARAAHLPTLSLGLEGQRRSGAGVPVQDAGRYDATLGLKLTIPLFAGGALESQKRQAAYARDQQRELLEQARRALARETQAQYQAVLSSLQQLRSTRAAVEAADKALASTRSGLDLGARSMTDLLLAIQTQSNAQNAHEQARHRHVLARLLLQQAAGHLGESELAAVNLLLTPRTP